MERPVLQMHVWQTNQPESFWFHANQRPLFCLAIPALTASLGSVTDIFSYNWYCTYTNDFPPRLKTSMWANWGPCLVCSECLTFYMTQPPEWPLFGGWEKQVTAVGWVLTSLQVDGTTMWTGRFWVAVLLWLLQSMCGSVLIWGRVRGPFLTTVGSSHSSWCVNLLGFWTLPIV
jgi:hypothetical protein